MRKYSIQQYITSKYSRLFARSSKHKVVGSGANCYRYVRLGKNSDPSSANAIGSFLERMSFIMADGCIV